MDKKKKAIFRIAAIGVFHSTLYLWLVPFVIVPYWGEDRASQVFAVAGVVSVSVVFTIVWGGRRKKKGSVPRA